MADRTETYRSIPRGPVAALCDRITTHPLFLKGVTALIVLASLLVGLETYPALMERYGEAFRSADRIIVSLFVIEIVLRIIAYGRRPGRFFLNGWNVFDFVIVAVCLIPIDSQAAAALRLVRVIRALRLLTAIPQLQLVMSALLRSIPSIGYVGVLLVLLFYIYAVIGTTLFGANDPANFGTLHQTSLSLFRTITLEDWTDLMYSQIFGTDVFPSEVYPPVGESPSPAPIAAILYFGSFVLIGTMIVLNLFIGVVINSLTQAQREQAAESLRRAGEGTNLDAQLAAIQAEMAAISERLERLRGQIG